MSHTQGFMAAVTLAAAFIASSATAQPPEGDGGRPRPGVGERRGPPGGGDRPERRGPPEGRPGGERGGPPNPERMIEHAMSFDADGDGKLDRSELTTFFEQMQAARMQGGPGEGRGRGGPGGGRGEGGPREGFGGPDGLRGRPEGAGPPREGRGPGVPGSGPGGEGRGAGDPPRRDRNEL